MGGGVGNLLSVNWFFGHWSVVCSFSSAICYLQPAVGGANMRGGGWGPTINCRSSLDNSASQPFYDYWAYLLLNIGTIPLGVLSGLCGFGERSLGTSVFEGVSVHGIELSEQQHIGPPPRTNIGATHPPSYSSLLGQMKVHHRKKKATDVPPSGPVPDISGGWLCSIGPSLPEAPSKRIRHLLGPCNGCCCSYFLMVVGGQW